MAKASSKSTAAKPRKGSARGKSTRGAADANPTALRSSGETPAIGWRIGQSEYDERVARVRRELANQQLDALVLFHPVRMAYLSGFFHLSTERPMAIVVPLSAGDGLGALIPQLEQDHIAKSPSVSQVKVYPEYPTGGTKHPMHHLADLLTEMKLTKKGARIGYDSNGYLDFNGYDGPPLTEVVGKGVTTTPAREIVDRLRAVKSQAELAFITESCVWGNLAHRLMHDGLALGRGAMEISLDASVAASKLMIAALGPGYQPLTTPFGGTPAQANFTAGANTALPHGLATATGLRRGDVLSTYTGADVGGYNSELERTMILGEPTPEFAHHFDLMMQLQQVAFDALRPGRTLAAAERDVSKAFADLGVAEMQRHHTGHGIGLEGHEAPFIDKGDETAIVENMVLTAEPGLYVPGLAGFRHSDTVVVRATGVERLTYYPRDLESMVVPL
ncbi:MAG: Xaa-Pro peptidase family protein [Chloroflexota bacterium]|nr:Xaa-Pro peptidase family protein [Chloroflexota bacterium]